MTITLDTYADLADLDTAAEAIRHADAQGFSLSTYADPTCDGVSGCTVDHALLVASEDPSLVYIDGDLCRVCDCHGIQSPAAAGDLCASCSAVAESEECSQCGQHYTDEEWAAADHVCPLCAPHPDVAADLIARVRADIASGVRCDLAPGYDSRHADDDAAMAAACLERGR